MIKGEERKVEKKGNQKKERGEKKKKRDVQENAA